MKFSFLEDIVLNPMGPGGQMVSGARKSLRYLKKVADKSNEKVKEAEKKEKKFSFLDVAKEVPEAIVDTGEQIVDYGKNFTKNVPEFSKEYKNYKPENKVAALGYEYLVKPPLNTAGAASIIPEAAVRAVSGGIKELKGEQGALAKSVGNGPYLAEGMLDVGAGKEGASPTATITPAEARNVSLTAAELPLYFFSGAKGLGNIKGNLGQRMLNRSTTVIPEAGMDALLRTLKEENIDIKDLPQNFLESWVTMAGLSNAFGGLSDVGRGVIKNLKAGKPPFKAGMSVENVGGPPTGKVDVDFINSTYDTIKKDGGITVDLGGNRPTKGYAYSPYKEAERIIPKKEFSPEHLDKYVDEMYDNLTEPGHHIGGWIDDKGDVYLDISVVGDKGAKTIAEAKKRGQLAVFDLESFDEIPTGWKEGDLYEKANLPSFNRGQIEGANQGRVASGTLEAIPKEATKEVTSGLALTTEKNAVSKKLTDDLGDLPTYKQENMDDWADAAVDFINKDPEKAMRVALGQEPPPQGVRAGAVYAAQELDAIAKGDTETLRKLANAEGIAEYATEAGREVAAFNTRLEESPVARMKEVIQSRAERVARTYGKDATEVAKSTAKKIKEVTKIDKVDTEKVLKSAASHLKTTKTPAEVRLAKRVIGQVSPPKPKEVDKLVDELFRISKQSLPDKAATPKKKAIDLIKDMFDRSERATEVYNKAKDIVRKKIGNNERLIAALDEYEATRMTKPVSEATVTRAVKEELRARATTLRNIIDRSVKDQTITVEEITEAMSKEGFSDDASRSFGKLVSESLNKQIADAKTSALKRMGATWGGKPNQTILDKIEKLSNYGALDDADYLDLARSKIGIDISSPEAKQISESVQQMLERKKNYNPETRSWTNEKDRLDYGLSRYDMDEVLAQIKGERSTIKETVKKEIEDFKITKEQQTALKAAFNLGGNALKTTSDTIVSLVASIDNSFLGRQGFKTLFTEPKRMIQAKNMGKPYKSIWWNMAKNSFSDIAKVLGGQDAKRILMADVYSRPRYMNGDYVKAGILSRFEEQFPSSLPARVPGIGRAFKASEAAFENSAVRARVGLYDFMADLAEKNGVEKTDVQIKDIGKLVNSLTARGEWGKKGDNSVVRLILWAPKMLKSNIDTLTAHGLGTGLETSFARKQAAIDTVSIIAEIATVMTIANAISPGSAETDPRSSDFGDIKVGNTRFNITGGMDSLVTLASRILTQESKSSTTGKVNKLNSGEYGSQTVMDVMYDFLENKTAPAAKILVDTIGRGETFKGDKPTVGNQAPIPISVRNVMEQVEEGDYSAERILGSLLDVFGISTNTYEKRKGSKGKSYMLNSIGKMK